MIAAGIFLLLLLLLGSLYRKSWRATLVIFIITFTAIALLFNHHVTESLGLSF